MTMLSLPPLRALTYLNDHSAHHVHVVGLGCEASFGVVLQSEWPSPGHPRPGVWLDENHGFTLDQLDAFKAEITRTYPGLPDRTHKPLTNEAVEAANGRGQHMLGDPGVAAHARYLAESGLLEVTFSPAEVQTYDLGVFEDLAHAPTADLATVEVTPAGIGILFPSLGLGLSALMLYRGRFERSPDHYASDSMLV